MSQLSSASKTSWTKLWPWLGTVNSRSLKQDLFAGLTGAVIALPQGVAFALVAGLPVEYGLYTAIIPVILAALFGSSRHLISGPTTPISIVIYTTIASLATPETPAYVSLVLTLTFMVGIFQLVMGMARLGMLVNFISHSVVIGFTTGAALLIITAQMKNIFAFDISRDLSFWETWGAVLSQLTSFNSYSLTVAAITFVTALLVKKLSPAWPSLLIAMVVGSFAALFLGGADSGIKLVGALPIGLPPLSAPDLSLDTISRLASGALAIALLGLLEAVSIARSITTQSHDQHDANREFIGQGISNIGGSFFSSYASSGSFTRSGINFKSGAQTPLAAVFSALAIALIIVVATPLAAYLPIPAMGAILLIVAWGLIDWHHIRVIFKANPSDAAVLVTTFIATLFVELTFAIYVGVILSLILHLNRISKPSIISRTPDPGAKNRHFINATVETECPQLKILRIDGSLFFGSINYIERALRDVDNNNPEQKRVLIIGSGINFIDVAGAEFLIREKKRRQSLGGDLYLCGVKEGVCATLKKGEYLPLMGQERIFTSKDEAIHTIYQQLDMARCQRCKVKLFRECWRS